MNLEAFARLGRLHPLLLHLPIGLLFGALVLEYGAARGQVARSAFAKYLWLASGFAILTAASGWVLGHEDGYGGETLERHERLGLAVAVATTLAALFHDSSGRSGVRLGLFRAALVAACVLLVPAGHLGSTLTHGDDWLAGPRPRRARSVPVASTLEPAQSADPQPAQLSEPSPPRVAPEPEPEPETYSTVIAPLFETYCTSCHGAKKRKGHLRLDSPQGLLAGGESGPAFVPFPRPSLVLERARLPLEHEDHMPPEGKPQPSAAELDALEAWLRAGAPFGSAPAAAAESVPDGSEESALESEAPSAPADSGPSEVALAALDAAFVHHEWLEPGKPLLWVSVAATAPNFTDADFARLVVPLAPWIGELSLARSAVSDQALSELAGFAKLVRLDLRASRVTSEGLKALPSALEELVLSQTKLTDSVVEVLLAHAGLRKLTVWSAGLSSEALARLRAPGNLTVIAGDELSGEPLESEGALTFTSDRPEPGAEAVPAALRPVNANCPVSGSPVNSKYACVYTAGGASRVIGFCCPNCPKEFWADPEKFAAKLP